MRAGVLRCGEPAYAGNDDYEPLPRFSANRDRDARVTAVMLPPGVRAAAVGRRKLPGVGEPFKVDTRMPGWTVLVLRYAGHERLFDAHEIPGPVDVPLLAPGQIDVPGTVAELEPFRGTALAIFKREDGWLRTPRMLLGAPRSAVRFGRSIGSEWKEAVGDLRHSVPQHERPEYEPVEGVAYDTWVEVLSGLKHDEVHPSHVDAYATYRSVPSGRWTAVDAAWEARARKDPRLAAWADYDRRRVI